MNPSEDPKDIQTPHEAPTANGGGTLWRVSAVTGILLAIVAWGMFFFAPVVAAVIAAAAVVASALGVKSGRGCLRDLSVTAIIACVVLVAVFGIFNWGIPYAIDSL